MAKKLTKTQAELLKELSRKDRILLLLRRQVNSAISTPEIKKVLGIQKGCYTLLGTPDEGQYPDSLLDQGYVALQVFEDSSAYYWVITNAGIERIEQAVKNARKRIAERAKAD